MNESGDQNYSKVAIVLHWLIALCFFGMVVIGFTMTRMGEGALSLKFNMYQWHKSFGILILLLTLVRLAWRSRVRPPKTTPGKLWEARAATTSHILLYGFTILVPLAGWAMVSASPWNIPTVLFETVPWPHLPGFESLSDKQSAEAKLKLIHKALAYGTVALVLLHALAALRHHLILKDTTLVKMLPILKNLRKKTDDA